MSHAEMIELPDLMEQVAAVIEANQGKPWQILLTSSGPIIEVKTTVTESEASRPNVSMTISKVTHAKFRLGDHKRTVFKTE